MNKSFYEQAEELRKDIINRNEGYNKWLELWAKEESPFKVGQTFVSPEGDLVEIASVTARYLVDGKYEWFVCGYIDTHVLKRKLYCYAISMETEEE